MLRIMFWPQDWKFCWRSNCRHPDVIDWRQDRSRVRQWLQQVKADRWDLSDLRALLSREEGAWDLRKLSDEAILQQVAEYLLAGQLHVHEAPPLVVPRRGGAYQRSEVTVAFPLSDRQRPVTSGRVREVAPVMVTAPEFESTQAAGLVAAARDGVPFCEICEKMRLVGR